MRLRGAGILACAALAACSGAPGPGPSGVAPAVSGAAPAPGTTVRFVTNPARPRLALLAREGDPGPALVAAVAVDLGPAAATALSGVVEARLLAAGFPVDTRVDRQAFRVRLLYPAGVAPSPKAFFAALAEAFRAPVGPGTPEVRSASSKLQALRRNPLPAPEAAPAAYCASRLGVAARDRVLDPATPEGLAELDAARAKALTASRTALAAVGPLPFVTASEQALAAIDGWPEGPPPDDALPAGDALGAFAAHDLAKGRARLTVAVRVGDPLAAATAAERLGEPDGALRSRLGALPTAFRVTEVLGVARPRGGCVSITAEADSGARDAPVAMSALAAAIARKEISAAVRAPVDAGIAARAVVGASDPRDAAARAAWWALSGSTPGAAERWATALAIPADDTNKGDATSVTRKLESDLAAAMRASTGPVVERRGAIEQGQGEVWVLLASPCGTADEGPLDAGSSALGALAVTSRDFPSVTVDPWITPDGVGVVAHAPPAAGESPDALAIRVAAAASRAFAGAVPDRDSLSVARAASLARIERDAGPHGAALESLLGALAPDHPAQVYPFGLFTRVAAVGTPVVVSRWQMLAQGPLRMAVLANASQAQAQAAFGEADHWLAPRPSPRTACPSTNDSALQPGRYEVELPAGSDLAQALVAAPVAARGQPGRELAELGALLLGGERGELQAALDRTSIPVVASVRLLGGRRASAIVVDVRAPQAALGDAVTEVKNVLSHLGANGPAQAAFDAAIARQKRIDDEAALDPRARLVKVWGAGGAGAAAPQAPVAPTRPALQQFFATAFRDAALVVVEAKRK